MDSLEGLVLSDGAAFTEGLANIFIVAQLLSLLLVVVLLGSAFHAYLCGTVQRRRAFRTQWEYALPVGGRAERT